MKNLLRFVRALMLLVFLLMLFALAPRARAQQPNILNVQSNFTGLAITTNDLVTWNPATNTPVTLRQNQGVGYQIKFHGSNAGTANNTLSFAVTVDNTNWTTGGLPTWTLPSNGTNSVVLFTNFDRAIWNNFRKIAPWKILNGNTNGIVIDSLIESHGNQ